MRTATRFMTQPADPRHHYSHTKLLSEATAVPGTVDAVIVPTNRKVGFLQRAMRLAGDLDCLLIVLCSRWSHARPVLGAAAAAGVRAVAVDVPPRAGLPQLETDDLLDDTSFSGRTDTSMKRNIGLAVAHMMPDWRAVLFLDDDITVTADDVRGAAGLLADYAAVGLTNAGFPDNSVVCHANREVGGTQDTFIGGGALVVPARSRSYFPHVYNEDWFFLFEHVRDRRVAVTGRAEQKEYDPYRSAKRARRQEFGDCLAEGVFELLDDGRGLAEAGVDFWRDYLTRREAFIAGILDRTRHMPMPRAKRERAAAQAKRERMVAALTTAQASRAEITPKLCVRYLDAWQRDRLAWAAFLDRVPPLGNVQEALRHLSLHPVS